MNFCVKYSDNEIISLCIQNNESKSVVNCNIYLVSMESISIKESVEFKLPLLIDSNSVIHCYSVSRIFCEGQLVLLLYQDSKYNLFCLELNIENKVINELFSYNCKERIESISASDGPVIIYTTSTCLYIMISDYTGYFKIYQYNNENNNTNRNKEVIYLGRSLCDSTVNQQLIFKTNNCDNNNNKYKILDIDLFNTSNPIFESECEDLYELINEYEISSIISEYTNILLVTDDNKVIFVPQDNYNERVMVSVENVSFIKYYQPNLLFQGFIINGFQMYDIGSENIKKTIIPDGNIESLKEIIIISSCILYVMKDSEIYITDSFITKQYNIIDNMLVNEISDGDVMKKILSSVSLKFNEMIENILNNNEIENRKIDLINQIFNRDISLNRNHVSLKYDRSKLDSFIPSNILISNVEEKNNSLLSNDNKIENKRMWELIENRISRTYDGVIGIELKINNCSEYELKNCEVVIISDGISYSTVYNIKQQSENILPSQSIDVQIECNLNHSQNLLPSYINIFLVFNVDNNEYIEYMINYGLSDVILNHNNTEKKVEIYNKALLLWRESIPKDIETYPNIRINKMKEKCYKILYNSNDSFFLLLIRKYKKICTCDLYSLLENVDIESCFDIFSNEMNLLMKSNNNAKIYSSQIKISTIMDGIHKEVCLECMEKIEG